MGLGRREVNIESLSMQYQPDNIVYRDKEIEDLKLYVFSGKEFPPESVFIYGSSGSGKTAVIKHITSNYKNKKANIIYVNAGECRSIVQTLNEIYRSIKGDYLSLGTNPNAYSIEIVKALPNDKHNIIIIDEIDKIINGKNNDDLCLYPLLRPHEGIRNDVNIALVLIANDITLKDRFNSSIQSSFGRLWLKFYNYNEEELYHILLDRIKLAIKNTNYSWEESALKKLAKSASPIGDARYAIDLLKLAFINSKNNKLTEDDAISACERLEKTEIIKEFEKISDDCVILLFFINGLRGSRNELKVFPNIYSLYEIICAKMFRRTISYQHALNILETLEKTGIISSSEIPYMRGKPLKFDFRTSIEIVDELLLHEISRREDLKKWAKEGDTEVFIETLNAFKKQTKLDMSDYIDKKTGVT